MCTSSLYYGIQKNRIGLTMNDFFMVFKTMEYILGNLHFSLQISPALVDSFENCESEMVILDTMNPINSNFCVTRFFRFFQA